MNGEKDISYLPAIREVLVIGIIKIILAVVVFAFSAVITETVKIYFFQADSWLTDNSQAASRRVLELYR
jgi:hypothetical protein